MYRICRNGRASKTSTMAGKIVRINSTSCASMVFEDNFSISTSARRYRTKLQIARVTIRAQSWNSTSSSMAGHEAS